MARSDTLTCRLYLRVRLATAGALLATGLAACTAVNPDGSTVPFRHSVASYYQKFRSAPPDGRQLKICHGHTCQFRTDYLLTDRDTADLDALFNTGQVPDAEAERAQIQKAVALMERRVGVVVGTSGDEALNKLLTGTGDRSQTDCVDEAANTTSYILVLHERGLLRHHTVEKPALRQRVLFPHYTAVVREKTTGVDWAVDSWFRDNGEPPLVMTVEVWRTYDTTASAASL